MQYFKVKLLLIGSERAGKTQLSCRYGDDTFSETEHTRNDNLEFKFREIEIDNKIVNVQVWDKGGMERFRTTSKAYFRAAHVIGICVDLSEENEFENVKQWIQEIERYAIEDVPIFVIGTKCEQFSSKLVDFETIRNFCSLRNMQYIECSAKLNINVEDVFESMTRKAVEQLIEKINRAPSAAIQEKVKPKKNCAFQ